MQSSEQARCRHWQQLKQHRAGAPRLATPSCAMALGQYMPRTQHFVFDPGLGGLVLVPKVELVHEDASECNPKSHGTHHHWRAQQHLPHSVPNTVMATDPLSTCSSHMRCSSMSFPR